MNTVLVTRPAPAGPRLCVALEAARLRAVHWPAIRVTPLAQPRVVQPATSEAVHGTLAAHMARADAVVVPSPAAARAALALLPDALHAAAARRAVWAMGPGTARTLAGLASELPAQPDAHGMRDALTASGVAAAGQHVVLLEGSRPRPALSKGLAVTGCTVTRVQVYSTVPETGPLPPGGRRPHVVVYASPSAVDALHAAHPALLAPGMSAVCIGGTTAAACAPHYPADHIHTAAAPTDDALVRACRAALARMDA